jgi:large subunit ribosomal protein L15
MRLHDIKPNPGSKHRRKRLGRGESSGTGKTAGRGHKGQKSRSGGGVRLSFEGGQMPIYRRLPKRGFNNAAFKTQYAVVNVGLLEERFDAGATIDEEALRKAGIVKGRYDGVKILGDGDVSKKFTISVAKVSASAREKLEKAGGSISEVAPAADATPPKAKAKPAPAPVAAEAPAAAESPAEEEAPAAEAAPEVEEASGEEE